MIKSSIEDFLGNLHKLTNVAFLPCKLYFINLIDISIERLIDRRNMQFSSDNHPLIYQNEEAIAKLTSLKTEILTLTKAEKIIECFNQVNEILKKC